MTTTKQETSTTRRPHGPSRHPFGACEGCLDLRAEGFHDTYIAGHHERLAVVRTQVAGVLAIAERSPDGAVKVGAFLLRDILALLGPAEAPGA